MTAFHPGQLVMVGIRGRSLDGAQADFLRRNGIRAVVLFRDNLGDEDEARALISDLRAALGEAALIAVDQEGGAVVRATFLPQAPSAMALGATGDAALARDVGAAVARGIGSLGCNWNFAPVLDVNNNPANPVIAERSFSADPGEVARLAAAWMRGAMSEGVACCIKHFPGHGDTSVDSHLDLPIVDKPQSALDALELMPFRALCGEAPAVMTAHIVYPQIDADHPATLSRALIGRLLRDAWHYDGVVITDSLVMQAIHDRYGHERAAALALCAGADMVMALGTAQEQAAAIHAIDTAVKRGALALPDMLRARARLDALAARFPSRTGHYRDETRAADDRLMRRAWAQALTVLGNAKPPRIDQPLRVVTQRCVPGDGVSEPGLSGGRVALLFERFGSVEFVQVDDLAALDWQSLPVDERVTVLASNTRARHGVRARTWRPHLHVVLWNPFQVQDVAAPAIVTWGYADGALAALRAWLEGHAAAPGRSPVPLLAPSREAGATP
jgi:beta-N-acetylhexosaminidase